MALLCFNPSQWLTILDVSGSVDIKKTQTYYIFFSEERVFKCSFALYGKVCHLKVSVDEGRGPLFLRVMGAHRKGQIQTDRGQAKRKTNTSFTLGMMTKWKKR